MKLKTGFLPRKAAWRHSAYSAVTIRLSKRIYEELALYERLQATILIDCTRIAVHVKMLSYTSRFPQYRRNHELSHTPSVVLSFMFQALIERLQSPSGMPAGRLQFWRRKYGNDFGLAAPEYTCSYPASNVCTHSAFINDKFNDIYRR